MSYYIMTTDAKANVPTNHWVFITKRTDEGIELCGFETLSDVDKWVDEQINEGRYLNTQLLIVEKT